MPVLQSRDPVPASALAGGMAEGARDRRTRRAVTATVIVLVLLSLMLELVAAARSGWWDDASDSLILAIAFTVVGGLIAERMPRHPVGWLFLAIGAAGALSAATASFTGPWVLTWTASWAWWIGWGLLPLFLLVFPTGQLPSERWRAASRAAWVALALTTLGLAAAAWHHPRWIDSDPVPEVPRVWLAFAAAGVVITVLVLVAGLGSLVGRWRRAETLERRQLETLFVGVAAVVVCVIIDAVALPVGGLLAAVCVPVAAGVAVLRHRLFDLDLFVNRAVVYGTLTSLLIAVYAVLVWVGDSLLSDVSPAPPVAAALIVAVLLHPLRTRLQGGVNHMLYGHRGDPYAVVSAVGRRLEDPKDPSGVLTDVAKAVAEALALPYVAIELESRDELESIGEWGRQGLETRAFPLSYRGRPVGRLLAAPRTVGHGFDADDLRLLEELSRQVAVTAHALDLAGELRRSREGIVRAREEERRRLRRDLHDHVGAALAGLLLKVGAGRATGSTDALGTVESDLQELTGDLRLLIDDLRPAALDQLGLPAALEKQAARLSRLGGTEIFVQAEVPRQLPAAIEVAAYSIATEAMANVVKHSGASTCRVTLACRDDTLELTVADDGSGLREDVRRGVGLDAMQERAAELGGTCVFLPGPNGGTEVHCILPLVAA